MSKMPKGSPVPSPKPMPTTSWPDRCDYSQRDGGEAMKAGLRSSNDMNINPGRAPDTDK